VHTPFKKADRLTVELQKLRVLPAKLREHAGAEAVDFLLKKKKRGVVRETDLFAALG
ncbi:unnamed protein product, partial [Effrenium voratum]